MVEIISAGRTGLDSTIDVALRVERILWLFLGAGPGRWEVRLKEDIVFDVRFRLRIWMGRGLLRVDCLCGALHHDWGWGVVFCCVFVERALRRIGLDR